jgi:hypothetical protein
MVQIIIFVDGVVIISRNLKDSEEALQEMDNTVKEMVKFEVKFNL